MKLKFWKKDDKSKDETVIQVTISNLVSGTTGHSTDIYVKSQTSEKALDLFDKLKERTKQECH